MGSKYWYVCPNELTFQGRLQELLPPFCVKCRLCNTKGIQRGLIALSSSPSTAFWKQQSLEEGSEEFPRNILYAAGIKFCTGPLKGRIVKENFRLYLNFIKESLSRLLLNNKLRSGLRWCYYLFFRGECGLREYSEVKTVTIKIPQKNS